MAGGEPSEFMAMMGRRVSLLRHLGAAAVPKRELEEELTVSRSTIDRGIRELANWQLVERTDGGYRRTMAGEMAIREYDRFRERVEALCEGAELLASIDAGADLDPALLSGATVLQADRTSPQRPMEALYDLIESASDVRGFAPAAHPRQVEAYRNRVRRNGMQADLVLTGEVISRLLAEHAEPFEETVATDQVRLWQADADVPYSLTLAETADGPRVAVVVYADHGVVGCILNDDPDALAWAERRFERERRRATRIA